MKSDLIIKDVDLDQLEADLCEVGMIFEDFDNGDSPYPFGSEQAGFRILDMLKTWAEYRKAEKEDEELARKLTDENPNMRTEQTRDAYKQGILAALKEQRKRLGK